MPTGWSTSDLTGGYAVSGTGNTVVTTTTQGAVRSATSHASGKWYAELTVTSVSDASLDLGFATSTWTLGRPGFGSPSNSIGITPFSGSEGIWLNNTSSAFNTPSGPMALGSVISVCADVDNGKYYFLTSEYIAAYGANGWNGLTTANPALNIGGLSYALTGGAYLAVGNIGSSGVVVTLNSGQSAFARAIPSGFSAWDNWANLQQGTAFLQGAGVLAASPGQRALATAGLIAGGGLSALAVATRTGAATFAGVSQFSAIQAQALMASALGTISSDSALGTLASQQAAMNVAGSVVSTDTGIALLLLPTTAAAATRLQNALIDALFRGQALAAPATWYVALVTQVGSPVAHGVECTGAGYARASIPSSLAAWSGTQGAGTTVASSGVSDLISNNVAVTFPAPTGDWGTLVGYEFWDQTSGGNRWLSGKLSSPMTINNADPARRFAVGNLILSLG